MRACLIASLLASVWTAAAAQDTTSQSDTILDVNKPTNFDIKNWKAPHDSNWQKAEDHRHRFNECRTRWSRGKITEHEFWGCVYGASAPRIYDPRTGRTYDRTAASNAAGDIVVYYKITEQNNVYWRVAWRLPLKNKTNSPVHFSAIITFLDADGFDVAEDHAYNLSLGPEEEREFTGATLIDAHAAATIAKARVEFER